MSEKIHFTKMHGAGNDYIYVDAARYDIADPSAAAIAWSDRHKGIGADGLVLIGRLAAASAHPDADVQASSVADFTMRIFNADGSEAMMCGNASRCIGKYVYEKGLTTSEVVRLHTLSGVKTLQLHVKNGRVGHVTVDMGEPRLSVAAQYQPTGELPEGVFVSMGNPHYVIFTDATDDVAEVGKRLERHAAFPERCNIELAHVMADGQIRTRVWERGSGVTMACGTGACATAVAASLTGRCGRSSRIVMDGGTLDITWRTSDDHVLMTGPAAFVFEGEIG